MANTSAPNGLSVAMHEHAVHGTQDDYTIASGYATGIFSGDLVKLTGVGRNVALCGATEVGIGVFQGCRYVNQEGRQIFSKRWPAGQVATDIVASIANDKQTVFQVQADTWAAADMATPFVTLDATAGSATTGRSNQSVSNASKNAAVTNKTLKVIGLVPTPDNDYGAYAKLLVSLL